MPNDPDPSFFLNLYRSVMSGTSCNCLNPLNPGLKTYSSSSLLFLSVFLDDVLSGTWNSLQDTFLVPFLFWVIRLTLYFSVFRIPSVFFFSINVYYAKSCCARLLLSIGERGERLPSPRLELPRALSSLFSSVSSLMIPSSITSSNLSESDESFSPLKLSISSSSL